MKKLTAILLLALAASVIAAAQQKSDQPSDEQSKSFTVQSGGLLEMDVEPGSVRLEPWSKDEVFIEAEGIDERHPDRLVMTQSGNTVSVKYRDSRHHVEHLGFTVNVPAHFNVDIRTSGGSIKQHDLLTGNFKADTRGGSIEIARVAGTVDAETGGGSIKVEKVEGDARLQTGGGSIETGTVTGTLNATTGGGSMTFRDAGGKVKASTGGGSVRVENAKEWIDITTGGGGVSVHGAKYGAKIKTGGGSIEMEDITGMVNVSTGGGSINCELTPGEKGNSTITTGGGEIHLTLSENAKCVIDATINGGHGWGKHHRDYTIRSDFKADSFADKDDDGDIHAVYTLNGGGPTITLETSDSDIEIRKMSSR